MPDIQISPTVITGYIVFQSTQSFHIVFIVMSEFPGFDIIIVDTYMISGNPQPFFVEGRDDIGNIIGCNSAISRPVYSERIRITIEHAQAFTLGTYPHFIVARIGTHTVQFIGTQLRGVFFINRKLPAIKFIQPALGGKPHASLFILGNPHHVITGQPVFYPQSFNRIGLCF